MLLLRENGQTSRFKKKKQEQNFYPAQLNSSSVLLFSQALLLMLLTVLTLLVFSASILSFTATSQQEVIERRFLFRTCGVVQSNPFSDSGWVICAFNGQRSAPIPFDPCKFFPIFLAAFLPPAAPAEPPPLICSFPARYSHPVLWIKARNISNSSHCGAVPLSKNTAACVYICRQHHQIFNPD